MSADRAEEIALQKVVLQKQVTPLQSVHQGALTS